MLPNCRMRFHGAGHGALAPTLFQAVHQAGCPTAHTLREGTRPLFLRRQVPSDGEPNSIRQTGFGCQTTGGARWGDAVLTRERGDLTMGTNHGRIALGATDDCDDRLPAGGRMSTQPEPPPVPPSAGAPAGFDREFLHSDENFTVIGTGAMGGKARGLAEVKRVLQQACPPGRFADFVVDIPRLAVVATDVFEHFMEHGGLWEIALSDAPDDRIALAFQQAELPPLVVGDLRALVAEVHQPLAVRSSSLLEDTLQHPFAGTYATKMIANNQTDVATRFRHLGEAVKFVWASTFFRDAKSYMRAIGRSARDERMAVIIQEVVGLRHGGRFYPTVAGVIRTYNFYPTGPAQPADGVVSLALGLGKTIVDGGVTWTYAPSYPRHSPPYGSVRDLLHNTQAEFWAVNMGPPPPYDPINEAEYLVKGTLPDAEADGVLKPLVSTYDAESDRVVLGMGRSGPRVLNFAPLLDLQEIPLNQVIEHLACTCKEALQSDVEIEFAVTLAGAESLIPDAEAPRTHRFGMLQMRPMLVAREQVEVTAEELHNPRVLVATERVLGNGILDTLTDIVYIRPEGFEARHTPAIAAELEALNRRLADDGRLYVLIGFGRWGSSDPWLGVPVTWPQISGARVIVEATRPDMNVDPSQGSHFFHNMTSFRVQYLTVSHGGPYAIDWAWLAGLPAECELEHVRHVRAPQALVAKVDGRAGRGVILHA